MMKILFSILILVASSLAAADPYSQCLPIEQLGFHGHVTPDVFPHLKINQEDLGLIYITHLSGECILRPEFSAQKNIFLHDDLAVKDVILEKILGNTFDSIKTTSINSSRGALDPFRALYDISLTTDKNERWWFNLHPRTEAVVSDNELTITMESRNYGGSHDIVGHGLGSGTIKEMSSKFYIAKQGEHYVLRLESLTFASVPGGIGHFVFNSKRTDIEQRALAKFERKRDQIVQRLTTYLYQ